MTIHASVPCQARAVTPTDCAEFPDALHRCTLANTDRGTHINQHDDSHLCVCGHAWFTARQLAAAPDPLAALTARVEQAEQDIHKITSLMRRNADSIVGVAEVLHEVTRRLDADELSKAATHATLCVISDQLTELTARITTLEGGKPPPTPAPADDMGDIPIPGID